MHLKKTRMASAPRWKHLVKMVFHLIATRQFALVRAALRRHFMKRFIPLAPIEYVEEEAPVHSAGELKPVKYFSRHTELDNTLSGADDAEHAIPLVSVVIPCFNYGSFVHQAIDSVLAQTLSSVEIIVVEGGSTDGVTAEIVRNIYRPRTRVIMQDRPTLVGANRNTGIAAARGLYICCLDADDTIDPTYLEKAVYILETHRYDVVSTGMRFIGARTGTMDVIANPTLKDLTEGNHLSTCGVFTRKLWEITGGFVDTGKGIDHIAEDWDFWVRVAATGARIRNITGEHLFNYTIQPGGCLQ